MKGEGFSLLRVAVRNKKGAGLKPPAIQHQNFGANAHMMRSRVLTVGVKLQIITW